MPRMLRRVWFLGLKLSFPAEYEDEDYFRTQATAYRQVSQLFPVQTQWQ